MAEDTDVSQSGGGGTRPPDLGNQVQEENEKGRQESEDEVNEDDYRNQFVTVKSKRARKNDTRGAANQAGENRGRGGHNRGGFENGNRGGGFGGGHRGGGFGGGNRGGAPVNGNRGGGSMRGTRGMRGNGGWWMVDGGWCVVGDGW